MYIMCVMPIPYEGSACTYFLILFSPLNFTERDMILCVYVHITLDVCLAYHLFFSTYAHTLTTAISLTRIKFSWCHV